MTDQEHEFLIVDRQINAPIDYADDFRELIKKLAYHLRFYKDEKLLGFSVAEGPEDWSWNLDVIPTLAKSHVLQIYEDQGRRISDELAMQQGKEAILHITGGLPIGFLLEEVAA